MEPSSRCFSSLLDEKAKRAVQQSLKVAAEEIRILSLDKRPFAPTRIDGLAAQVEAAEMLGFQVGAWKDKLARLRSLLDDWEDGLDRAAARWRRRRQLGEEEDVAARTSGQKKRLRKEMAELDEEEERERKVLRVCCSTFESVATAPWPWEN